MTLASAISEKKFFLPQRTATIKLFYIKHAQVCLSTFKTEDVNAQTKIWKTKKIF